MQTVIEMRLEDIMKKFGLVVVLLALVLATTAYAQQQGKRRGPPQEAIDACSNLTKGDTCSFSHQRRGDVDGVCIEKRQGTGLICRPNPPKEAIDACDGKAENDTCSFSGKRGTVSGTCFSPPERDALACKPDRGGKGKR